MRTFDANRARWRHAKTATNWAGSMAKYAYPVFGGRHVAAAAALEAVRPLRGPADLVFPSPSKPGRPLSDMTLTKVLRDTGLADRATVHGFRTAFRTWASEKTNADHAVMELCLAHHVGTAVERAHLSPLPCRRTLG